jgi:hypothetical protein
MKSTAFWALLILNAALLAAFVWRVIPDNAAVAQVPLRGGAAAMRPGDYIMVSSNVTGANAGVVVVVDQTNALFSAFSYDDANHRLEPMQKIDLRRVFQGDAPVGRAGQRR